jgi:hypothetical protein
MSETHTEPEGGCACGSVRYQLSETPLFTHCCHCRWCHRESGSAFALNAMIESKYVSLLQGEPEAVKTPSNSGKGQTFYRCPNCKIALWSHYIGAGTKLAFVRVGTLDDPDACPPDIHIYTSTKQPWVILPEGAIQKSGFYDRTKEWPERSLSRLANL